MGEAQGAGSKGSKVGGAPGPAPAAQLPNRAGRKAAPLPAAHAAAQQTRRTTQYAAPPAQQAAAGDCRRHRSAVLPLLSARGGALA